VSQLLVNIIVLVPITIGAAVIQKLHNINIISGFSKVSSMMADNDSQIAVTVNEKRLTNFSVNQN